MYYDRVSIPFSIRYNSLMKYDLEDRCKEFAVNIRQYVKTKKLSIITIEDYKQLIRSSGSIGANYIEANQNLGTRDCKMRMKIAKKEARETSYWISILIEITKDQLLYPLFTEVKEIEYIQSSIVRKLK